MMRTEVVIDLRNAGWPEDWVNGYFLKRADFDSLVVEGVYKSFGSNKLLSNAGLVVSKGDVVGIIGSSGVGKTTFLKMLVGFLSPDAGSISVKSGVESVRVFDVQNFFGFAAQNPSFYEKLTVEENMRHFGALLDVSDVDSASANILTQFDLYNVRSCFAGDLSRGQQKRLDIALALLSEPRVLVLDEPTSDLDLENRERVWEVVRNLKNKGTTIVIASHSFNELVGVCSKFYSINSGSLVPVVMNKSYEVRVLTGRRSYDFAGSLKLDSKIVDGVLVISTSNPNDVILSVNQSVARLRDRVENCVVREVVQPVLWT